MVKGRHTRTPGPWRTDPECGDQSVLGPDGYMVADCAIFSLRKGAPSGERCASNARLIAAAPGMLAKLNDIAGGLSLLRMAVEAGDPKREMLVRIDDMMREISATTAKAEDAA